MPQVPIETARATLRRLRSTDYDLVRALESDAGVMKFTSMQVVQNKAQTQERLATQITRAADWSPFGVWLAEAKTNGTFIGWFMLLPAGDGSLELGFMLERSQWGRGYATEIAAGLRDFARSQSEIATLIAKTSVDNHASMKILQKLGFKFIGEILVPDKISGKERAVNSFALSLRA